MSFSGSGGVSERTLTLRNVQSTKRGRDQTKTVRATAPVGADLARLSVASLYVLHHRDGRNGERSRVLPTPSVERDLVSLGRGNC